MAMAAQCVVPAANAQDQAQDHTQDHAQDRTQDHARGFRIDDVAYCTDVSKIPKESMALLQGLRVLVLDALRFKPHPGHFSINEALDVIAELRPKRAYLTHMSHDVEHEAVNKQLPPGVELAYDGLKFEF